MEILKRVAERVFEIGELTGKTGKIENLKAKIAELEVRAKRLYPKDD
ncbi:MAG: hypothetical protein IPJ38_17890 [Dechloromonas sp.]|uniref:Uncharacterized protein n=1 Tax=Candidatus Dechloromonas phosphorivorans TaxID=2899244 RepID=A0A935MUG8_9RHOO|nr:hypothetical protein [Candidatus Dechloromonas phosphorivorans]